MSHIASSTESNHSIPSGYSSAQLRKEVDAEVSALVADGAELGQRITYDQALDNVARRYRVSGPILSRYAHYIDWFQKRSGSVARYVADLLREEACPVLPGFDSMVRLPRQLLLDGEVVELGDSRMTLARIMEQLRIKEEATDQEAEQMERRAAVLRLHHQELKDEIEAYETIAAEAVRRFGVGTDQLFYDCEKKAIVPNPNPPRHS